MWNQPSVHCIYEVESPSAMQWYYLYHWLVSYVDYDCHLMLDVLSTPENSSMMSHTRSRSRWNDYHTYIISNTWIQNSLNSHDQHTYTTTHNNNHFTALCLGLPGWAGTRRNTHPPTIMIITQSLSASSIYHDPCSNCMLDNLFAQPLSMSSLVYLLVWSPPPHIPYISSPNQYLLFTTHAHTIATCLAVVSILYHLLVFLVFLSTPYLELYLLP